MRGGGFHLDRLSLSEAKSAAFEAHMMHYYCLQPEGYEEAMQKMRIAAAELHGRDRELLGKLWRAALAAAASIDPYDETDIGYGEHRGCLHGYYRMLSGMVEDILGEKRFDELQREIAEREPKEIEDDSDLPF